MWSGLSRHWPFTSVPALGSFCHWIKWPEEKQLSEKGFTRLFKSVTVHHCGEVKMGIWSKLVSHIHSQEQRDHSLWHGTLITVMSPKENSPSLLQQPSTAALPLTVGQRGPPHTQAEFWLPWSCKAVCRNHNSYELMCAVTKSCSEAGTSQLSSPSNGSHVLSVLSFMMLLVPWR